MKNRNNIGFEVLIRRILLKGTISLQTGLHIGTGRDIGASAVDNPILKDFLGKPFIPGSSLKGVLRSNLEAFLRAYNDRESRNLCCEVVGNKKPCISKNADELKFLIAIGNILKEKGPLSKEEIEYEMSQRGWKEDRIKEAGGYPKLLKLAQKEGIIAVTNKEKYKFQKDAPSLDELIWK
ncbi:MAG: RAMP superfamily CRISPR-associated protein, partial [Methanosarcinales archaeon]